MKAPVSSGFNPTMLILARESRGLSQSELVEQVNASVQAPVITPSRLSRLEAGLGAMDANTLDAMAAVLSFPQNFFCQQARMSSISRRFFRKAKSMPKQVLRALLATIDIDRIRIETLLRSTELETKQIPSFPIDGVRFKSASDVARAVRQFWHIPRGPIENVTKIMEDAGILVVPIKAGSRFFMGLHVPTETGSPVIFVNEELPGDRMRFTIAHEGAHIVMHDATDDEDLSNKQADEFASEFLMPRDEIRSDLRDLDLQRAASLKLRWKTSMAALIRHAREVGSISQDRYEQLCIRMAKSGYRLSEPRSVDIPKETPSLLSEIVEMHQTVFGYSRKELMAILWLDEASTHRYLKEEAPKLRIVRR